MASGTVPVLHWCSRCQIIISYPTVLPLPGLCLNSSGSFAARVQTFLGFLDRVRFLPTFSPSEFLLQGIEQVFKFNLLVPGTVFCVTMIQSPPGYPFLRIWILNKIYLDNYVVTGILDCFSIMLIQSPPGYPSWANRIMRNYLMLSTRSEAPSGEVA